MTMFIRKHFWTINLLTIALCSFFAAKAIGRLVEASLPRAKTRRVSAPAMTPAMMNPQRHDVSSILARNIFCSTCEPVVESNTPQEAQGDPASNEPVKTSLNLKLIATLISDEDRAWSFAAIADGDDNNTTQLFAIGTKITDQAVVTDIMEKRVLLLNGNRNEYLDLDAGANVTASSIENMPPRPSVGFRTPSPMPGMEQISGGIRKVGAGKYEIERSALNKVLANTTLLARSARIVPSVRNGKPNGFKLYAIRPGSLYSLLGMFNGDTINAINGHPITTPDKALEVYTKLRNASHLTISFARRGVALTHEYNIR